MTTNEKIDKIEELFMNYEPVDCPLKHRFTPGVYVREIFMPKGTAITSMIHKTEHQFFILKGKARVYNEHDGEEILEAPYIGVTKPGTRRVLFILEDCIWVTVHPTEITPKSDSEKDILDAVDRVGEQIIEHRPNPLIGGMAKNNVIVELLDN